MDSYRNSRFDSPRDSLACLWTSPPLLILQAVVKLIKVGAAGIPEELKEDSMEDSLDNLLERGFESLELQFLNGVNLKEEDIETLSDFAGKMTFSAHGPYRINLASSRSNRISESEEWILECSRVLERIGGKILVFHPGYYAISEKETSKRIKNNLRKVLGRLESESIDIKLGLETTAKRKQFGTFEEIMEVTKSFRSKVVPVLDFAHIHARTSGSLKTREDFARIIDRLKGKLKEFHFHIACVDYEKGEEVSHQPLKAKDPDIKLLIDILKEEEIDSTLILETPQPLDDIQELKSWIHG